MKGSVFCICWAVVAAWLGFAAPAAAQVERFAVLVGANAGEASEPSLR